MGFARSAIDILKADLAVSIGIDLLFPDDATVEIDGQVFQRRLAGADQFYIDDPPSRQVLGDVEVRDIQGREESNAKHPEHNDRAIAEVWADEQS